MSINVKLMRGVNFNKKYKNTRFYKFLNNNFEHKGFYYKKGSNIDTKKFNPSDECSSGGLNFCEYAQRHHFWRDYGEYVSEITVPDDANVYIENETFKAD